MDTTQLASLPTQQLVTLLEPLLIPSTSPFSSFHNWARTFHCTPSSTYLPRTVDECRLVVEYARRQGKRIRAAGVGHSPSDLACTEEVMVRMTGLDGFLGVSEVEGGAPDGKNSGNDANNGLDSKTAATTTSTPDPSPSTSTSSSCSPFFIAHVQGGITLASLHSHLASHSPSLAMSNLGSISEQTLAGVISTATHGSGYDYKVLSNAVDYLVLVSSAAPGAPLIRCSRKENVDLFKASLCGLGLTGLIVEVGYRVERAFRLRQVVEAIPIARLLPEAKEETSTNSNRFGDGGGKDDGERAPLLSKPSSPSSSSSASSPTSSASQTVSVSSLLGPSAAYGQRAIDILARSSQHTRLWWYPQTGGVVVARANRTYEPLATPPKKGLWARLLDAVGLGDGNILSYHVTQFLLFLSRYYLFPTSSVSRWVYTLSTPRTRAPPIVQVDVSHKVFAFDCLFPQYTTEWAIPYERTSECLAALNDWYTTELGAWTGQRPHFPLEIRFVDADDIWLSPAYGRRTTYLGIVQYRPYSMDAPEHAQIFTSFAEIVKKFEGRPHWAKQHDFGEEQLRKCYERFDDFVRVVKEADPEGRWRCAYTARHLGQGLLVAKQEKVDG